MADLYKYGVAVHLYKPMIKRAVVDFAIGADWTPVAGDVKISKDGAAAANVTNLPAAITMGNGAVWDFSLTAAELQAAKIRITIVDSAAKAVEDNAFEIDTYGNASAQHGIDLSPVSLPRYTGTARAGGATSVTNLQASTPAASCQPGDYIVVTSGTGVGESNRVNSVAGMGGATPVATMVQAWAIALDATSTYEIGKDGALVPATATSVWDSSINPTRTVTAATNITSTGAAVPIDVNGRVTANTDAVTNDAITAAALSDDAIAAVQNDLDVNVARVNNITVVGNGTDTVPWGPAP